MAGCYSGRDGALELGSLGNVAMLTSWSLTQSADVIECSHMGSRAKKFHAGNYSFEGSAEAIWSDEDETGASAGEILIGDKLTAKFYIQDSATATADLFYKGDVIITSIEVSAAMDDVVRVSMSFQGTGALQLDDDTKAEEAATDTADVVLGTAAN